ncbi:ABC transporter permease [Lacticaseibacillus paracasei]|uniref:ABC transporter permease n=1 Tax=Lacticaseibacillus paracasei TaxID=1597 RepID=UPI00034338B7|nr:ABC transporter permease [Lacticaseibacillus paracasei]EPD01772.1 ABC-2 type transporter [Lacticaseibacillus paracasei subsp. paracasei Lpp125]WCZ20067.1 ABC transporter permease [Lacticaseibacillus paracasei]
MLNFFNLAWLDFKSSVIILNAEEFILLRLGYPLISMMFYVLLATYSFNPSSLAKWVVGNAFLLCINTCIFVMGTAINADRATGRLRSIIVSPTQRIVYLLSKSLFSIIITFFTVLIGFVVGALVFNLSVNQIAWPQLLICIALGMLSATAFGLLLSTFALITDSMHFILNFIATGLLILTGANFPLKQLPVFWQYFAQWVPLTHAIDAANQVIAGNTDILSPLLVETALAISYLVAASYMIKWCEHLARRNATLEMF